MLTRDVDPEVTDDTAVPAAAAAATAAATAAAAAAGAAPIEDDDEALRNGNGLWLILDEVLVDGDKQYGLSPPDALLCDDEGSCTAAATDDAERRIFPPLAWWVGAVFDEDLLDVGIFQSDTPRFYITLFFIPRYYKSTEPSVFGVLVQGTF